MKKFSSWLMGNQQGKQQKQAQSGRPKKNVHWKSAERPSPPGRPVLIPLSDQQPDVVTLKWERPKLDGGSPITGYVIEHRRMGSPHWVRSTPASVTGCEVSISGLEPGWRYQFRAIAENVVGKSDPSELSDPLTVTLQRNAISVPRFANELTDTSVVENERVEFRVSVLGQPPPEISWFKDGYEIFSSRRTKIVSDNDASVLVIHQVALTDEGEIKCTATNRAGHVVTKAMLMVEAPPKIRLPRNYEDGLIVEADEVLRLKVGIAGQPPPAVFWLHEGEPITNGGRHEMETTDKNSTLKIDNVKRVDRGEYSIRAVNKLGEDNTSFLVTVTSRPNPPGKVRLNTSYGKSATLSWTAPDDDGGCKIGSYIVEYFRIGWNVWLKAATTRQLSTTLNDLIEGSEYKFRVKAENPYGLSDPGEESDVLFIPDPKRGINKPDGDDKPVPPRRKTLSPQRALPDGEERLEDASPRQRSPMFDRKMKPQILDNEDLVREMSYGTNLTQVRKSSPPTAQGQGKEEARRSLSPPQFDLENERKTFSKIEAPSAGSVRRSLSPRKGNLEGETKSASRIESPAIESGQRTPSSRSPNGGEGILTTASPSMGSGRRTPSPRKPNGEEKKKTISVTVSTSTPTSAATNPLTLPPRPPTPLIFPMYPPVSPKTPPAIAPAFGPVFTSVVAPVLRFTPKQAPASTTAPTPAPNPAPAPTPTPAPLPMPPAESTIPPKPPLSPKSRNSLATRRLLSKQGLVQPQEEQSRMRIEASPPAKQERPSLLRLRSLSPVDQPAPITLPVKPSSPAEKKPPIPIRNQSLSPVEQRQTPAVEPSPPPKEKSPALGVHRKLSPIEQLIHNTLPVEPPPLAKQEQSISIRNRSLSPVEQIARNTPPKTPPESKKISSALQRSEEPVDLNESQHVHRYSEQEPSPEPERQPPYNGNASNPKIHISRPGSDPAPLSDTEKRDEVHTSSEFMLVLFHKNSKVKDKEKQDSFDLDLEEALQPPPISISSPDLASMEFSNLQTFPLRRSVSSTELLYERAMARFYEAVEMEEAERAKKIKASKEKLAVQPATVRKRLGSMSEAERLSFEKRSEMRRRSADIGELASPSVKWDSKDNIATMRPLSRARGMLNQQFRQDSQETDDASDYQMKTGESFDVESDYTASTDSVSEDSIEKFKRELVARTRSTSDELETYHPRNMSAGVFTPYRAPTPEQSAIVLNRPVPLASPDFVPKPILKRPSNESVVKDESPSPNPIAPSSPLLPSSPAIEKEKENQKEKSKGFKSFFKWDRRSPTEKNTEANAEPPPTPKLQKSISLDSESKRKAREEEERQKQEAARISQEEAKVVVDHYSDIVRQVGSTRKYNPPLYLNREELKKAAERAEKEGIVDDDMEDIIPPSDRLTRLQKPRLSLVERHQIQHVKETASRLAMTINDQPKIPETPSEEDATPSSASQPSQRSESRGRTKIVKVKKIVKKRVPSATRSRDASSSRPPSSIGASSDDFARRHITRPRISEPSPVRREYQPAPPSPPLKVYDPEPIAALIAVPPKSTEELTQEAEEKVRSAVSYMTDVCLFIAACYVYLFKDARLVLPILALMVYRQLGEAIRNNIPDWIKKKKQ